MDGTQVLGREHSAVQKPCARGGPVSTIGLSSDGEAGGSYRISAPKMHSFSFAKPVLK